MIAMVIILCAILAMSVSLYNVLLSDLIINDVFSPIFNKINSNIYLCHINSWRTGVMDGINSLRQSVQIYASPT